MDQVMDEDRKAAKVAKLVFKVVNKWSGARRGLWNIHRVSFARFLSISSEWGGAMLTFRGVNIPGKDWILDKRLLSGDKKVTCNPRPYKFHNCFNTILIEFQVPLNAQT